MSREGGRQRDEEEAARSALPVTARAGASGPLPGLDWARCPSRLPAPPSGVWLRPLPPRPPTALPCAVSVAAFVLSAWSPGLTPARGCSWQPLRRPPIYFLNSIFVVLIMTLCPLCCPRPRRQLGLLRAWVFGVPSPLTLRFLLTGFSRDFHSSACRGRPLAAFTLSSRSRPDSHLPNFSDQGEQVRPCPS